MRTANRVLYIFATLTILYSCKSEKAPLVECFPGILIITLVDTATFEDLYPLLDALQFSVDNIRGCDYFILNDSSNTDSIEIVRQILDEKDYIKGGEIYGVKVKQETSKLLIEISFNRLIHENYADWQQTLLDLNLQPNLLQNTGMGGTITVPEGGEKRDALTLEAYDIILEATCSRYIYQS